jgi:hypothetical protein
MEITSHPLERRAPVCGISSAAVPFIGAGIGYIVLHLSPGGDAGWSYIIYAVLIFLALLVAGLVLAVVGTARRERLRALPWIALFLNAGPLLYVILTWK